MTTTRWDILTGDADRDRRNVAILFESVADLYGPQSVDELVNRAVDRAIEVTGAERGILFLDQDEDGAIAPTVVRGAGGTDLGADQRFSATVVNKVWSTNEPSLTVDTADQQPDSLSASIMALRLLSVMAVPLPVQGKSVGVLYVDSTAKVKEFTQSDYSVFQALGGLIATAVQNARLMAEKEAQERIKRELDVAQRIQRQLFPTELPRPEGFELAALARSCEATSGDYYDVMGVTGERIALVMGDVSGHGLGPALLMASTRAHLRSFLFVDPTPDRVLEYVNRVLSVDSPENTFVSLFLGLLEPRERTITYVSAGHNPALHVDVAGQVTECHRTGPVLGIMDPATFQVGEPIRVAPGEAVLLYTDGLFEAVRGKDDREMYGEPRLHESLARHARDASSAQGILEGVIADLDTFVGDTPLDDDVTALVVRGTP